MIVINFTIYYLLYFNYEDYKESNDACGDESLDIDQFYMNEKGQCGMEFTANINGHDYYVKKLHDFFNQCLSNDVAYTEHVVPFFRNYDYLIDFPSLEQSLKESFKTEGVDLQYYLSNPELKGKDGITVKETAIKSFESEIGFDFDDIYLQQITKIQ